MELDFELNDMWSVHFGEAEFPEYFPNFSIASNSNIQNHKILRRVEHAEVKKYAVDKPSRQ